MNKNRFLALAMTGAMMTGTLATAVPVFAEGGSGQTTVSLTVEAPKNTYTMTVPANTALNSDGAAKELANGIKISNGTLEDGKNLMVTATSGNNWKMKADNKDTEIGYTLYSDDGTTTATSWEFTQAEANAENGTKKDVYAKVNETDLNSADPGSYSDVITFTAEVGTAKIAAESVSLDKTELSLEAGGSETLTATVTPDDATDKTVTWTSDNNSVATVDEDGTVKAVAAGSAVITATADGKSATCKVTVTFPEYNKTNVETISVRMRGYNSQTFTATYKKDGTATQESTMGDWILKGANFTWTSDTNITVTNNNFYCEDNNAVIDLKNKTYTLTDGGSDTYHYASIDSIIINGNEMISYFTRK